MYIHLNKLSTGFLKHLNCAVCTGSEMKAECLFKIVTFLFFMVKPCSQSGLKDLMHMTSCFKFSGKPLNLRTVLER